MDRHGFFEPRGGVELEEIFDRTYGYETSWQSRIRSVNLVADALNKGEMARAMMVAVLMRLPHPGSTIRMADVDGTLAKAGFNPDEPRDEQGRWTNGGASSDAYGRAGIQLADAGLSDVSNDPVAQAVARADETQSDDQPKLILAAAEGEDEREPRFGVGGNYPPLEELIPQRLLQSPAGPAVQYLDNLLDISGPGDEANLAWAELQMGGLLQEIHKVDPNYVYHSIGPGGGLAAMSWDGRLSVINGLKADLAAAIYRVKGDIKPLQEVTFEFLQRATNAAYEEGEIKYDTGSLGKSLSREVAIGNYVDRTVRSQVKSFFNDLSIPTDPESVIRINNRAYDTSNSLQTYRVPDDRVGDIAFDISLEEKNHRRTKSKNSSALISNQPRS
jgi:hypothetical protein